MMCDTCETDLSRFEHYHVTEAGNQCPDCIGCVDPRS